MHRIVALAVPIFAAALLTTPLLAQSTSSAPDPLIAGVRMGNDFIRHQVTTAAASMSDEDYAFRPTPEVRTFGQLLAHIADNNYGFCSEANGESSPPVVDVESTKTTKTEIDAALAASFDYCAGVYATMTDARARTMVQFGRRQHPALTVLMFKSFHNSLHYGNVITYMRLRGKVPPPSAR